MELTTSWQLVKSSAMSLNNTQLRVYAKYNSQSTANNTSSVSVELRIYCGNASFNCYTHSCNFTGGVFDASDYKGSYYHGWSANTETTILSQTKTITHNSDGTKSFNVGGYFTCSVGVSGTVSDTSVSLPKINRVSTFTLSKATFDIGDTIEATITRYVSTYHQDLYMTIGSTDVLIQSSASGTIEIDTSLLANQIYQAIPNAKFATNVFKLYTYDSNETYIGSYQLTYRANVVDSEPTFTIAYQDTNATTTAITSDNQQIIQNNSTLQFNFTDATALHYASLSTYAITINGETRTGSITTSTLNVTWGVLNLSNNTNASVSITDSRGFTTTKTVALEVLGWETPSAIITCNRKQNYYTETDITVDATYSSLDSKNTITIQYRIKKTSDNTWGNWNNLSDNVQTTFNADNQYSWDVQVKLEDEIGYATYNLSIGVGIPIFFIDRVKRSLGINCFPVNNNDIEIDNYIVEAYTVLFEDANGELGDIVLNDSIANYRKIKVYFLNTDDKYFPSNEIYTNNQNNIQIQLVANWNGNGIIYAGGTDYSISGTNMTYIYHYHDGLYGSNVGYASGTNNLKVVRIEGFK